MTRLPLRAGRAQPEIRVHDAACKGDANHQREAKAPRPWLLGLTGCDSFAGAGSFCHEGLARPITLGLTVPVAKERSLMAKRSQPAKGLDAATAQELIEHAVRSIGSEADARKATPIVEAALEVARLSSRAAGKRTLQITGIEVHTNDTVFQTQSGGGGQKPGPIATGPKDRIPIAWGDSHKTCYWIAPGVSFCIYF
jgi:hypothetical protein